MPHQSLLLSIEAVRISHTPETEGALRYALANTGGIPLRAHSRIASAVTFDPQRRWLASAGEGEVYLWTLNDLDGSPTKLSAHSGNYINALAFDPGGHWLASADMNGVDLWSTENFHLPPVPVPMADVVAETVAFDPKGRWLAVGSSDRCLRIWDFDAVKSLNRKPRAKVKTSAEVLSIAFDPQGRWITFANDAGEVFVWSLSGLKQGGKKSILPRALEQGGENWAKCVAVDPYARYLATAGGTRVYLWLVKALERPPRIYNSKNGEVNCIAFSSDGKLLYLGGHNGSVWFVVLDNWAESTPLHFHEGPINALAFDALGALLASAGQCGVRIWRCDRSQDEPRVLLKSHQLGVGSRVVDDELHPQGRWLALGCEDRTLRVVALAAPEAGITLRATPATKIQAVAFDPLDRWLASLGTGASVLLWPLTQGTKKPLVLRHRKRSPTGAMAFDPRGRWLALGFEDGCILIWDLEDPNKDPRSLRGASAAIHRLAFDPKGRWLAAASHDLRLWSLNELRSPPLQLSERSSQYPWGVSTIAFDPLGRWLSGRWGDGYLCLWEAATPQEAPHVLELGAFKSIFYRRPLAFSWNGEWLANFTNNQTVTLWQLSPPQLSKPTELPLPDGVQGTTMAFDPLSRSLVAFCSPGLVLQWALDPEVLCRKACVVAGRNFTQQEWELYFGSETEYRSTCVNDHDR